MSPIAPRAGWSLRSRVLRIAGLACAVTLLAGSAAMYLALGREDQRLLDQRLVSLSRVVLAISEHEWQEMVDERRAEPERLSLGSLPYRYQVWSRDGRLLDHSADAPPDRPIAPNAEPGFASVMLDGEALRVYTSVGGASGMRLQVAEPVGERRYGAWQVIADFAAFLALPLAAVCGVALWRLRASMATLHQVTAALERRSPDDLTPIRAGQPPSELVPMISELNLLFGRIESALDGERNFCSMAAHELRSPLSGLRAQAQLARGAADPAARDRSLTAIMAATDKAAHLVDQLLELSRSEGAGGDARAGMEVVAVEELARSVIEELQPELDRRRVRLATQFGAPLIFGQKIGLAALLRNLLLNAVRYAPDGAPVELTSCEREGSVVLQVDDAGPGIAAADREFAFERFNRLGRVNDDGVGLGLAIVRAVIRKHGAEISLLDSPLGGLRVEIEFRPPPPPQAPPAGGGTAGGAPVTPVIHGRA